MHGVIWDYHARRRRHIEQHQWSTRRIGQTLMRQRDCHPEQRILCAGDMLSHHSELGVMFGARRDIDAWNDVVAHEQQQRLFRQCELRL